MPLLVTGIGTLSRIDWAVSPTEIPVASAPTTPTALSVNPALTSALVAGTLSLEWWVDPTNGLSIQNVHFKEGTPGWKTDAVHVLGKYLQWRNLRLIFEGVLDPVRLSLDNACCMQIVMINGTGALTLSPDHKKEFGFALTVHSLLANVADPRSNTNVTYDVDVQHAYLFGMPCSDQEPQSVIHAIKVYPTLTVSLHASGTVVEPPPDIAADLKMIHAPQVTRDFDPTDPTTDHLGQRLPPASYQPTRDNFWKPNDVISFLTCDTNDDSRPKPGGVIVPNAPKWDYVFDYLIPGIRKEMLIDAVVYKRADRAQPRPSFRIPWPPAYSSPLTCYREPGQGEYDNIHITPYLGFDDPQTDDPAAPTAVTNLPWIEAPIAGDEVIHLHWRWGSAVGTSPAKDFLGWQDLPAPSWPPPQPPQPNMEARAPLIPPNQSLRIKVTCSDSAGAVGDNTDDPSSAPADMTTDAVTVWYMATAHQPAIGTYSQFFGQGFGLGMYTETIKAWGGALTEDNWELLTHNPLHLDSNYHNLRWTNGLWPMSKGQQRVPNSEPALTRNKLTMGAPQNASVTPSMGGLAFDNVNKCLWVANLFDNTVSKFSASGALLGTFAVGVSPNGVAFDGANIWVVNSGSNNVTKLSAIDGTLQDTFAVGVSPNGVVCDGAFIWVVNSGSNDVTRLNVSDGTIKDTFATGGVNPEGVTFDGTYIWVTNASSGTVTQFSLNGMVLGTFAVGQFPTSLAVERSISGTYIWVVNSGSNNVTRLNASDGTVKGTFATGGVNPIGVAFDGANIWVVNSGSNNVTKLQLSDGQVVETFAAGIASFDLVFYPFGLAFDGTNIWVTNMSGDTVSKL